MENKLEKIGQNSFMDNFVKTDDILKDMCGIIESSQKAAYQAVNTLLVQRNWLIGYRIAEEELGGDERSEYGLEVIKKISKELNKKMIGKNVECVVEYVTDENIITARTYKDAPEVDGLIYLKTRNEDDNIVPGDIVVATVTKADDYDLYGVIN